MSGVALVGISGGSGAGKSTLVAALVQALGTQACAQVSLDSFYRPLSPEQRAQVSTYDFDSLDALDIPAIVDALTQLRAGHSVQVPRYDFRAHARCGEDEVAARPVVWVEGVLLLASPQIRALLDDAIYLDVPEYIRLKRRIERDCARRGRTLEGVLAQYFTRVRPTHEREVAPSAAYARLQLDGTLGVDELVSAILAQRGGW